MTDLDARKIAERWRKHEEYCQGDHAHMECRPQQQKDIATLLDTVVTKEITIHGLLCNISKCDHKAVVLRELNLEGWPSEVKP